jgi:hypothetical protein
MDWADRYEALRRQAMDNREGASGWGFALLLHRGVVAWMRVCSAVPDEAPEAQPAEAPAPRVPEGGRPSPTHAPGLDCQVVRILAQMILQTRQEAVA